MLTTQTHMHQRDAGRIGWDSCTGIVALKFFVRRRGIGRNTDGVGNTMAFE